MKFLTKRRCVIGEGPIWNEKENLLYFTNGIENEICILDIYTKELKVRTVETGAAAFCFDKDYRLIVSQKNGVYYLHDDGKLENLYDTEKYSISFGNDMKTGPDGRIYVGTQSGKRAGVSDKVDGKLYRIDKNGNVKVLLDGLKLSNGMEWSIDGKKFYHTDSDTQIIREYDFDTENGEISYTGREVRVQGVDGFTVDSDNNLLVACWGQGHIAVVDTEKLEVKDYIEVPAGIPASCAFCGKSMEYLAVVTANYRVDLDADKNAGFTYLYDLGICGRKPFLFG